MAKKNYSWIVVSVILVAGCVALEITAGYLLDRPELGPTKKGLAVMLEEHNLPAEINNLVGVGLSPHPYLLYQGTPDYWSNGYRQFNSLGYHSQEFELVKVPKVFRILALGGSTTFGRGVADFRKAWPGLLQELLQAKYSGTDLQVEVINAGLEYATSAEMLASWIFRHQYLEPDLVILHTGGNDVIPLMFPDYDAEYTHFRARGSIPRLPATPLVRWVTEKSSVAHLLALRFVPANALAAIYRAQPYGFQRLDAAEALERVQNTYPLGFERNLKTLVRSIKSTGADVSLISFVQTSEQQISARRADLRGFEKTMVVGLDITRSIMSAVAADEGIPYLQPDQSVFDDSLFVDNCHLNSKGQAVKAEYFAEFLEAANLLPDISVN